MAKTATVGTPLADHRSCKAHGPPELEMVHRDSCWPSGRCLMCCEVTIPTRSTAGDLGLCCTGDAVHVRGALRCSYRPEEEHAEPSIRRAVTK